MPPASPAALQQNIARYGRFLLFVAGLGGLLYGIDIGIIAAALLYLDKTISLSVQQTGLIVAAVLGGGMCSSLVGGVLADWCGRKTMMIVSGLMFVVSLGLIVVSQGFVPLFLGRLLQGLSGGVIAVVVPLYLAECLGKNTRGRGTAIFQFMLTFGIVSAAAVGWFYVRQADAAIAAAAGNPALILAAENHAWRSMFLTIVYPGLVFFAGSFFLSETPRYLFRKGRPERALAALRRSSSEEEAQLQMREMEELAAENRRQADSHGGAGSLLRRKFVVPFVLACAILALNQTTGINSVLSFLVVILKQAGMDPAHATDGDFAVKVLNCVMTLVGVALVDRKGRKFLIKLGTGGIVVALLAGALVFHGFESRRVDIKDRLQGAVRGDALDLPLAGLSAASGSASDAASAGPTTLTVLYSYGDGDKLATVLSTDPDPVLHIKPSVAGPDAASRSGLKIERALYGAVPPAATGWLVTGCLCLFISCYALGPGVVVWLMLSELMPTRIRSVGMGIALLLNQGAGTLIAAVFLPVVGRFGYFAMFGFWAVCTAVYFATAAIFLPETKGKTLEEIEEHFEGKAPVAAKA
jgi:MFS family permease